MPINAYEVIIEIDGEESVIELDDTYPSIEDWKTATHFAFMLARHNYPEAVHIGLVSVAEYEAEEYEEYDYIYPSPMALH